MKFVGLILFVVISSPAWADCVQAMKLKNQFLNYKIVDESEEESKERTLVFRNEVWPLLIHFKATNGEKEFQCIVGLAAAAENWDPAATAAGLIGKRLDETGYEEAFEKALDAMENRCRANDFRNSVGMKICLGKDADSKRVMKCEQQFAEREPLEDCERAEAKNPKKIPEKIVKAVKKEVEKENKKPARDRRPAGVEYAPIYIDPNNLPED